MPYKNIEKRKEYMKQYNKQYYVDNKGKALEYGKQYRKENLEKVRESYREWFKNNPEKAKEASKQWTKNHPEKTLEYSKQYRENHPEELREYQKQYHKQYHKDNSGKEKEYKKQWVKNNSERIKEYYKNNIEKIRKLRRKRASLKYKTDLKYNLNSKMAISICTALKGNKDGRSWESLTGYTLTELERRLNKTIPEGYTWQDFLSGELHIDHIIPISAFNFTRPEHTDFKRCWALENLRLLPARENLIKNAKLDRPFQPALRI